RLTPGMTFKGVKMPGRMGGCKTTVQNLVVVRIDEERNLVFVRGGVPGPDGSYMVLRQAVKGKTPRKRK
ncbi:MAG: 50S ribosomal protein L3, partial [Pseudomonadota bacterium]|nr:50S ribosomal protein L3 [Pseudomonadota bacterium]